jgi:MFS transporter, DHA2 family, multidrug resistance protein
VLALVMGMLNFTGIVLFPTLLHDLRGYPDDAIGWLIAARGMGNWAAFLVVVQFTRATPRLAIACGMAIQAAAALWMAHLDINLTDFHVFWSNMLQGFGQSIAFTPMTVMAFSTLPRDQVTEGSSIFTLMRNFGSSLFISVAILVVLRSTATNYARMTEFITPYNANLSLELGPQWNLENAGGLLNLSMEIQRQAAMIGYVNAFYLTAFTAAMAIPLAFFMRRLEGEQP